MIAKQTERLVRRRDPAAAASVIEDRIPQVERRHIFLEVLADVVRRAHALSERCWSVTLFDKSVRVNVGRVMVLELRPVKPCWLCVDATQMSAETMREVASKAVGTRTFRWIPDHPTYQLPLQDFLAILPDVRDALESFVDLAAKTAKVCPYATSYSPGVLDYVERELGIELPRLPEEALGEAQDETGLEDLFEEFLETYWDSDKGRKHREAYARQRVAAQRNLAAILERRERGEDVADAVLDGLLPHLDTRPNRERGTWIHVAPAVTKDVRSWFEGSGWTRPEDWSAVAQAILRFITACVDNPEGLAEACDEFRNEPLSKGFQTGMLTPALNALDPESFAVVNSKVVKVLKHYTGTELGAQIEDYTAFNDLVQQFVEQHENLFARPELGAEQPGDVFDQMCHWLVDEREGWPPRSVESQQFWKISPGEKAALWDACREGGYICIGWHRLGDLTGVPRGEFEQRVTRLAQEEPNYTVTATNQVWNFAQIPIGALVVANRGHREIVGVGKVTGPYGFHPEGDLYPHRLPVDWYDVQPKPIDCRGWNKTMVRLDRSRFRELGCTLAPNGAVIGQVAQSIYTLADCAEETGFPEAELQRWLRAIERKGQAIFYGPPGTGKTFLAERLAKVIVGGGSGQIELVQFHPSYAYEDFIQGIRPFTGENETLTFRTMPGRFLDFCKRIQNCPDPSVLIIDEINRAELSRVFGELMYLLEYRDRAVPLAGGHTLRVPSQLRILGAMNTADRSIALVDHALRRRFAFLPLQPRHDILERYHESTGFPIQGLVKVLNEVNAKIADPNYAIGISFFLKPDLDQQIEDIWSMEIVPYLEEYFFDQEAAVDAFRWPDVRDRIQP